MTQEQFTLVNAIDPAIEKQVVQEIFRIENPDTMNGMWYNEKGEYDPFIFNLTEGISAHLPMEPDDRYGVNEQRWFSGCKDFQQLQHWFSNRDVIELGEAGYKLYRFRAQEFTNEEFQTIFTRRGILEQVELDINLLFN